MITDAHRIAFCGGDRRDVSVSFVLIIIRTISRVTGACRLTGDAAIHCCAFIADDQFIAGDDGGHVHFLRLEEPQRKD